MKPTILTLSFLIFFTFTIKQLPAVSAHDSESDPVFDITNNLLRPGVQYYIVSSIRGGGGGGVSLGRIKKSCPLHVLQEGSDLNRGMPVTFSLVNSNKKVILESAPLTIKFNVTITDCDGSTVWKADEYDEKTGKVFVTIGGVEGQPSTLVKIQRFSFSNSYKLLFCNGECEAVSIYHNPEDYQRQLALSDDGSAFSVFFVRADSYQLVEDN